MASLSWGKCELVVGFSHAGSQLSRAPALAVVTHHLEHQHRACSSILLHPSPHVAPAFGF